MVHNHDHAGAKLGGGRNSVRPPPSCATDCRRKEESVCGVTITFITSLRPGNYISFHFIVNC